MKFVCGAIRVMEIMKLKILFLAGLLLLLPALPVFAAFDKKPEFRWQQLYRSDFNREDHYLYSNRFSAAFNLRNKEEKGFLKLEPFFEIRRNINKDANIESICCISIRQIVADLLISSAE